MNIVIDVSGVTDILLQKGKAGEFNTILQKASHILAPDLYIPELTNTMWKYYRTGKLTEEKCLQHIYHGIGIIDTFIDSKTIWQEAFAEGIKNNHFIYDMLYFVCARRNNAALITGDSGLAEIAKKNKIKVP